MYDEKERFDFRFCFRIHSTGNNYSPILSDNNCFVSYDIRNFMYIFVFTILTVIMKMVITLTETCFYKRTNYNIINISLITFLISSFYNSFIYNSVDLLIDNRLKVIDSKILLHYIYINPKALYK
jgi:type II secretory pathway component PulF